MTRSRRGTAVVVGLYTGLFLQLFGGIGANAQTQTQSEAEYAKIDHTNGSATLSVFNTSRPLLEGLTAVREEYGWRVDLEEPPHEGFPRGGKFESTYSENVSQFVAPHGRNSPPPFPTSYSLPDGDEAIVLNKIVSDYNQAGFPAKYSVITQSDGGYAVVGTAMQSADGTYRPVTPILDTTILIPNGTRTSEETLRLIVKELSSASGFRVETEYPMMWGGSQVTVGGNNIPARTLLEQTVPGLVWNLYFDVRQKFYSLNLMQVIRAQYKLGLRNTLP